MDGWRDGWLNFHLEIPRERDTVFILYITKEYNWDQKTQWQSLLIFRAEKLGLAKQQSGYWKGALGKNRSEKEASLSKTHTLQVFGLCCKESPSSSLGLRGQQSARGVLLPSFLPWCSEGQQCLGHKGGADEQDSPE